MLVHKKHTSKTVTFQSRFVIKTLLYDDLDTRMGSYKCAAEDSNEMMQPGKSCRRQDTKKLLELNGSRASDTDQRTHT